MNNRKSLITAASFSFILSGDSDFARPGHQQDIQE